jgi:hypothetical protein
MLELTRGDADAPYDWRSGTLGWFVQPIVYLNGQPRG